MSANQPKIYIFIVLFIVVPALLLSFISLVQIHKERVLLREKINDQLNNELEKIKRDLLITNDKMKKELEQASAKMQHKNLVDFVQLGTHFVQEYKIISTFFFLDKEGSLIYPQEDGIKIWSDVLNPKLLKAQQIERTSPESAYQKYKEIWQDGDESPDLLFLFARCARKVNQLDVAKKHYQTLKELKSENPLVLYAAYEWILLNTQNNKVDNAKFYADQKQELLNFLQRLVHLEPKLEEEFFAFLYARALSHLQESSLRINEQAQLSQIQEQHKQNKNNKTQIKQFKRIKNLVLARLRESPVSDYLSDTKQSEVYFYFKAPKEASIGTIVFLLDIANLKERLRLLLEARNVVVGQNPAEMVHYSFGSKNPSLSNSLSLSLEPVIPWTFLTVDIKDFDSLTKSASTTTYSYVAGVIVATIAIITGLILMMVIVHHHLQIANMKSDFVSTVTHELKTPLTSIRMFVETLQMGRIRDEEDRQECLDIIVTETERLSRLIDNVLSFAKIERHTQKYSFQDSDLFEVVESAIQLFKSQVDPENCRIEIHYPDLLPRIAIDPDSIQEVIQNLLSNAYKYSKEVDSRIKISLFKTEKDVVVEVEDNGIGIPDKFKKKIFEQFFRVDDHLTQRVDGCGLGLAIARDAARANGGDLKVVFSEVGKGSCFALLLPLPKKEEKTKTSRSQKKQILPTKEIVKT